MVVVDAGVNDADDDCAGADRSIPGSGRMDVGTWSARVTANDLAGVEKVPQVRKARIVRLKRRGQQVVRFGVQHLAPASQLADQRRDILAARVNMPDAA